MTSRLKTIAICSVIAVSLPMAAHALPIGNVDYTSTGGCTVNDLSPEADACIGVITGNDDNGFKDDYNPNKANFNLDAFDGVLGLFGKTNWSILGKVGTTSSDDGSSHSGDGITVNFGDTPDDADTWSTTHDLSAFEFVAIVLKQSNGFSAYLYEDDIPNGGEWETTVAAFGQQAGGLSHLSIYTGPEASIVPIPAGGLLLLTALGGLAIRRRK